MSASRQSSPSTPTPVTLQPAPLLLAPLLDRVQQTIDLRRPLWGMTEALDAVAPLLPPVRHPAILAKEAAKLGRRALLTDTIGLGLLPVEESAETDADHAHASQQMGLALAAYSAAFRWQSANQPAMCRASLTACVRALSLAISHSGKDAELQERALHAYALGEIRADAPSEEVADA